MTASDAETWIKMSGGIIAAMTAICATFKGLSEWRRATEQRHDELALRQREYRQKQAIFAREIVREVFADPKARAALRMLDWLEDEYTGDDGVKYRIRRDRIQTALRVNDLIFDDNEAFMRTRFESLYDHLEQIENLIQLQVIDFHDVETAFRYYLVRAIRPEIQHFGFLTYYDYPKAKEFVLRFEGKDKLDRKD